MSRSRSDERAVLVVVLTGLVVLASLGVVGAHTTVLADLTSSEGQLSTERYSVTTSTDATTWPMFRGNLAHTGHINTTGPTSTITKQWTFTTGDKVRRSSAAVVDGTVYIGSTDNNLYALTIDNGAEQWTFTTGGAVRSSPAVVNGTVYIGSFDGNVYALNATTGVKRWTFSTDGRIHSSPAVVDGTVYIGSSDNHLYGLNATTGVERWNFSTGGGVRSSPAVVDGTVYVGSDDGNVYALNATTGAERWTFTAGGAVFGSPAVVNGTVYVGHSNTNLFAVNATTGSEEWTFDAGGSVHTSPAVVDGTVYFGTHESSSSSVYAVDAATGVEQWTFSTGRLLSSPAVVSSTVYIGSKDNTVYALAAATGAERWNVTTSGAVTSSPAVVNGTVYIGSHDNTVYALTGQERTADPTPTPTPMPTPTATPTPSPGGPTVEQLDLTEHNKGRNPHAMFDAEWRVSDSDGNLETVELTLRDLDDGEVEDSKTIDVSGDRAEDTTRLIAHWEEDSSHTYEVELVVTDEDGNTASKTDAPTDISVSAPMNGSTYSTHEVNFEVTSNVEINTWKYQIDNRKNKTLRKNGSLDLRAGQQVVTIYASNDTYGLDVVKRKVTVDATYKLAEGDPQIHLNYSNHGDITPDFAGKKCRYEFNWEFCVILDHNKNLNSVDTRYMAVSADNWTETGDFVMFAGGEFTNNTRVNGEQQDQRHLVFAFDNNSAFSGDDPPTPVSMGGNTRARAFINNYLNEQLSEYFILPHHHLERVDATRLEFWYTQTGHFGQPILQGAVAHPGRPSEWEAPQILWANGHKIPVVGGSDNHCKEPEGCPINDESIDLEMTTKYTNFHASCWVSEVTSDGVMNGLRHGRCSAVQGFNSTAIKMRSGEAWMGEAVHAPKGAEAVVITFSAISEPGIQLKGVEIERDNDVVRNYTDYPYNTTITTNVPISNATNAVWVEMRQDMTSRSSSGQTHSEIEHTLGNPIHFYNNRWNRSSSEVTVLSEPDLGAIALGERDVVKLKSDKAIFLGDGIETTKTKDSTTNGKRTVGIEVRELFGQVNETNVTDIPLEGDAVAVRSENGTYLGQGQVSIGRGTATLHVPNVPESVHYTVVSAARSSAYVIRDVPRNVGIVSLSDRSVSFADTGHLGREGVLITAGDRIAGSGTVVMDKTLTAANLVADVDWKTGRSVVHSTTINITTLYIPRTGNNDKVRICPSADSLDDVTDTCSGGFTVEAGETVNGVTVTEVIVDGKKYYRAEGITGTGGMEVSDGAPSERRTPAERYDTPRTGSSTGFWIT